MKITIATGPIFPVPAVRGGAVQRLWEGLAREFAKRGHEVTIFARAFPGQSAEETVDGIRFVRRGGYEQSTSIKRDLVQCLLYALKTARHVPPGDVVVTNDFWMPAVLPWIQAKAGSIVVNANRFPKHQYWLYQKCAAFAAVSRAVADALKEQTPSVAGKVVIVPNAIDEVFLEERMERGALSREKEADGVWPVRILYVGRIHPEKGLALLANALRLLASADKETTRTRYQEPEQSGTADSPKANSVSPVGAGRGQTKAWECVLVGPTAEREGGGGEAFVRNLKRQLESLPVRFEAPVYDPADLAKIYNTGDILIYPSVADQGEAMPLAPLEGMARGLVPVVSDLAVFREYLEPGVNGMVFDHRSPAAARNLRDVLAGLLRDAGQRERMGAEARATALLFSPASVAERYLRLFEQTLQSGR